MLTAASDALIRSLRMYNSLVEKCFRDCVDSFRRKDLESSEEKARCWFFLKFRPSNTHMQNLEASLASTMCRRLNACVPNAPANGSWIPLPACSACSGAARNS